MWLLTKDSLIDTSSGACISVKGQELKLKVAGEEHHLATFADHESAVRELVTEFYDGLDKSPVKYSFIAKDLLSPK